MDRHGEFHPSLTKGEDIPHNSPLLLVGNLFTTVLGNGEERETVGGKERPTATTSERRRQYNYKHTSQENSTCLPRQLTTQHLY